MKPIIIPNISIPTIGIPTIGIPSVGFPSASGGGGLSWPAGMKEHIKAWYDPAKQGITNFDVIEAYVEDFTDWYKEINNGTVTATNKSFHFTEVKKIGSTNAIVRLVSHRINGEIKLNIKGVTEDNPISFTEYSTPILTVNKDGVYTLVINDATVGIYFTKVGVVDVTVTQLPTSILKDLSGNGNHAYLYGGKGKLNSGMGLYKVDFTSWRKSPVQTEVKPDVVKVTPNTSNYLFIQYANSVEIPSYKIKVIGLGDNVLKYQYATENGRKEINIVEGENELPTSIKVSNDYQIGYRLTPGTSVFTITQIPDYPDQLCYDGKMYAVAYDMPILTDYTVMAERTWFENRNVFLAKGNITTEAKYAFIFERFKPDGVMAVQSFGAWNDVVSTTDSCISYLTKNKYNGIDIRSGIGADDDMLSIGGALNKGNIELTSVCCHGAIIIADRSFTEEEINWLKQNWDKI